MKLQAKEVEQIERLYQLYFIRGYGCNGLDDVECVEINLIESVPYCSLLDY